MSADLQLVYGLSTPLDSLLPLNDPLAPPHNPSGITPAERGHTMNLTRTELDVCRMMGIAPDDFKNEKLRVAALAAAEGREQRDGTVTLDDMSGLSSVDRAAALQLSAEDLHVCRLTGISPAEHLKMKQQLACAVGE